MPSLPSNSNAQSSSWWAAERPQTPPKNAIDSHMQHLNNGDPRITRADFPIRSSSRRRPSINRSRSRSSHVGTMEEEPALVPLQDREMVNGAAGFDPIAEDNPASYDLLASAEAEHPKEYSLERRSQVLLAKEHLQVIFADSGLLFKFTAFLTSQRPQSLPMLVYYLDILKAIRAINYANAIVQGLDSLPEHDFTTKPIAAARNASLEQRAHEAFDVLVRDDLPAYVTSLYVHMVSLSVTRRVTGSLDPYLREASEGLAEVFCLTDPSRADNPIVFASEEFNRTTQYGMSYVLGRNCRFLQGPATNRASIDRLKTAVAAGKHHQEVLLNYRRDGSPFMNLLMMAPLFDSRGKLRYFIGAQVDVSGLVKECAELESLERLLMLQKNGEAVPNLHQPSQEKRDEFQELCEMFNVSELSTVRKHGGRMHQDMQDDADSISMQSQQPRLLLREPMDSPEYGAAETSGKLGGAFTNFLLVRPHPSLRILFASPSQRLPGILQSPFLDKIGGSSRVREEISAAFAEGRGVTAKVRWVSRNNETGRSRWIHCTPLLGISGKVGVWMVVIIDDEEQQLLQQQRRQRGGQYDPPTSSGRSWRQAPPVAASIGKSTPSRTVPVPSNAASSAGGSRNGPEDNRNGLGYATRNGYARSNSPSSLRIG